MTHTSDDPADDPSADRALNEGGSGDDASGHGEGLEPSKSQAKRDAHHVRDLGAELAGLGDSERLRIPLDDDVRGAIEELNRIRPSANGARKRQLGWLAKRLRQTDTGVIEEALESIRQSARASTADLHLAESWRDRLLGDGPAETPAEALTAFFDEHRSADRQELRQLQQRALTERKAEKPPAAARKLFKLVRTHLALEREQN